ncbi:ABC transporter permease [Bradyrhizobium sediminis]|uniref:ABC transporter permease n=1 Tax=Bradyrhizobium sediminis TaxID=2840469 RepID=A0A975RWC3_9BRAD|nr:ABC transporter permease [Bradyrhizobium sediminis]QWG22139.1 ABC transporter permease [Bradyrhizobium sediminis]
MAEPVIRIEGVSRTYHVGDIDVHALRDVSLTVERGEFIAIMGASGSGKSTLMSILGCLDRPSGGHYWFEGIDVAQLAEPDLAGLRSERLGFVFQSFNLLPRTSAIDNVALPLLYAMSAQGHARVRFERARTVLDQLGLRDRERNTPGQLSGGQQQRVAIARALINRPSLLLADEPTGNLDTRNSHEIMQTLSSLNREQGVTIIVVTHEADVAAFADRVLTMRDGQIISDVKKPRPVTTAGPEGAAGTAAAKPTLPSPAAAPPSYTISSGASWPFAWMVMTAAAEAIWRNKMRSALTMLGVFIGVAALIVMVSVGQGANEAVRKEIARLGTNLVVIVPGAATRGGARGGFGSASTLTVADVRAILQEATAVGEVGYLIRQSGQIRFASRNWTTGIQGVSFNYPPMTNWRIASGRAITAEDERSAGLVVILGETVRRELFGASQNPIGALVQVKGVSLRVIGVLEPKGQTSFGQDQDDLIMVPFTTAERKIIGVAAPSQQTPINWIYPTPPNPYGLQPRLTGFVNQIYVQAVDQNAIQAAINQSTDILARRHRVRPGTPNDFSVRNLSQIAETAEGSSRIMALLLAAVASISLVVGGIGIMNILLVSVTERTREIGLRMAIGARRLHVLLQFLAEAVFISVSGGIVGIVIGAALSVAVSAITGWPAPISMTAIAGGFLFSAAVGIFFGYYPARKAARLDPIEALRYE